MGRPTNTYQVEIYSEVQNPVLLQCDILWTPLTEAYRILGKTSIPSSFMFAVRVTNRSRPQPGLVVKSFARLKEQPNRVEESSLGQTNTKRWEQGALRGKSNPKL